MDLPRLHRLFIQLKDDNISLSGYIDEKYTNKIGDKMTNPNIRRVDIPILDKYGAWISTVFISVDNIAYISITKITTEEEE